MSKTRMKALGVMVILSTALVGGCGCAEIWSVVEELGAGLVSDDAVEQGGAELALVGGASETEPADERASGAAPDPQTIAQGERFGRHLAELCMRMRRGNSSFVEKHVDLPISVRVRVQEGTGPDAFQEVVFDDPYELRMSGICADLTWLGASVDVEEIEGGWIVLASGTGSQVELEFRQTKKGRPKLVRYWQL
jgi:hypothetical protein